MKNSASKLILAPIIVLVLIFTSGQLYSQFKDIPKETQTKLKSGGLILGFINPKNFSLQHSVNLSYVSYGNTSASLASYTATMSYAILKNLKVSADVTMQYSPFASLGSNSAALNKNFQNSFNGINLSRVSLEYKPLENMFINIDYINNSNPYLNDNYYNRYWNYNH